MDFSELGFHKVAAVSPKLVLADPMANVEIALEWIAEAVRGSAEIVLFPELGLTGYTAEDLFLGDYLLRETREALARLAASTKALEATVIVGGPYQTFDGRLYNCAFVIAKGRVIGAVPKTHLPNYGEYYERRWFTPGGNADVAVHDELLGSFRLSPRQLFAQGALTFGIEICEDLWAPDPPSTRLALAGAQAIFNLSASNDLVAKADFRRDLVRIHSARLNAAYVYVSSGPWESSKDAIFGGHTLLAENGVLLKELRGFDFVGTMATAEIDTDRLQAERRRNATFGNTPRVDGYELVSTDLAPALEKIERPFSPTPFVPSSPGELKARFEEILCLQSTALARRLEQTRSKHMVVGLSGGLDSTLACLVMVEAAKKIGWPNARIIAVSMPGPGTSRQTRAASGSLAGALKVSFREIEITAAVRQHLAALGHDGKTPDVTYENAQARERTQILFDLANKESGIVVGTGDMSELWLGWCTYNGDQMASYSVNVSVPKTLVKHLVHSYAELRTEGELKKILLSICEQTISPELTPLAEDGSIAQATEAVVGPYVLHDFFLFHHLRSAFGPRKIFELAKLAFAGELSSDEIKRWLKVFYERGFLSQFKRTTLPAGPKIGSVSVSPRADLRMPDEASFRRILAEIETFC